MKKQYDWQKQAFNLYKDAKAFMLNVCCGGGKTFAAIMIALYKKLPVIVIAPKNLVDTWREELTENGVAEDDIWIYSQPEYSKNKEHYEKDFLVWLKQSSTKTQALSS
jgi:superfamily II DNA or RNA helicase